MPRVIILAFLSCLFAGATRAGDDEVRLKPKNYVPSKSPANQSYRAHAYAPSTASQSSLGTQMKPVEESHWTRFSSKTPALDEKELSGTTEEKGEAFKQQQPVSVPTMSPDPKLVPEKKPFDSNGKKLTDAEYKAPKPSNEKNPMLKPRQGIKEPE